MLDEHVFVFKPWPTILHADLDSFYASVEQRDDPTLQGRPVVVGAGVVLAASYEAKARGIRTAMGTGRARALCPDAVFVPPRMSAYTQASRDVFSVFERTSPSVEALSIDEAFLDVRGLEHIKGDPRAVAVGLRAEVRRDVGLRITVGLATTKFLAKVASAVAKPDGLLIIPGGSELRFLHRLPVERLWGVGQVTAERLHSLGVHTVAEVAELEEEHLVEMVGRAAGRKLHALAHNRDPRRVRPRQRRRSIGAQRALGRRARAPGELEATLMTLIERVARRLRTARRVCRTVVLRLRFDDFSRATRSRTMPEATARTDRLLRAARQLLEAARPVIAERGLTLIGLALTNLSDQRAVQLALDFDRTSELDRTLDALRERFGSDAISRATLVGREQGPWVPLLPD